MHWVQHNKIGMVDPEKATKYIVTDILLYEA